MAFDFIAWGLSGKSDVMCTCLQNWVSNLIDFSKSVVGHLDNFDRIEACLAAGENVILLANHQSEADPGPPGVPRGFGGLYAACVGFFRVSGMSSVCFISLLCNGVPFRPTKAF